MVSSGRAALFHITCFPSLVDQPIEKLAYKKNLQFAFLRKKTFANGRLSLMENVGASLFISNLPSGHAYIILSSSFMVRNPYVGQWMR